MRWPGSKASGRDGAAGSPAPGDPAPPGMNPLEQHVMRPLGELAGRSRLAAAGALGVLGGTIDVIRRQAAQHLAERQREGRARNRGRTSLMASISQGVQSASGRRAGPGKRVPNIFASIGDADAKREDAPKEEQERILVSDVVVQGVTGELRDVVMDAINIKPNFAYTLDEVQDEVSRVFNTGYFSTCQPAAEDTRDGVVITLTCQANPELKGVVAAGANALPQRVVEDAFRGQFGKTLNFQVFGNALMQLNNWYEDRGIFGQVTTVNMQEGGVCELEMAEAQVGKITIRTMDRESGDAVKGATKPHVILKQLTTRPGHVYNLRQARQDIDAIFSMGLADDVNILPQPAEKSGPKPEGGEEKADLSPTVDLTVTVVERKTGGFSAGGGIAAAGNEGGVPGFVGSMSYSQRNFLGLNQKVTGSLEMGQSDSLFRLNHTDPWIRGDAFRTSRVVSLQNTRNAGNAIHGRVTDAPGGAGSPGEDRVVVGRLMGGVEYGRPLATGWNGTAGLTWQRTGLQDEHGRAMVQDAYGQPITFSEGVTDTMALCLLRAVYSGVGDSQMVFSMEQAVPWRKWLNFNRLRVRAERTVPVGPCRFSVSTKGGAILGDLPPYEAFPIGGNNSVRGYEEGGVGTGRNYVVASSELLVPLVAPLEGCLFVDYGTDLDSGASVPGDPAGTRGKPGSGYGYGAGVRLDSPVGPLRLEYAFNDKKLGRFHFGIGTSF